MARCFSTSFRRPPSCGQSSCRHERGSGLTPIRTWSQTRTWTPRTWTVTLTLTLTLTQILTQTLTQTLTPALTQARIRDRNSFRRMHSMRTIRKYMVLHFARMRAREQATEAVENKFGAALVLNKSRMMAMKLKAGMRRLPTMERRYGKMGGQTLRIFLSSTFRDMNAERDVFMKRYVPALRQTCQENGLHLSIVDLRWGVTVEQATNGEVVNICLSELDACEYFVGFIGARYGWRPGVEDLAPSTMERFPFLKSYIPGRSVTEAEMIYGMLGWGSDSRVTPKRAFMYFRSDEFLKTVPDDAMSNFVESEAIPKMKLRDLKRLTTDY